MSELTHYGILGMKWGVRRTEAQLARARGSSKNKGNTHDKKTVKDMSDEELRKVVNRLQMERQYSQLSGEDIRKGKKYVDKVIKVGATLAAVTTTTLTLYNNAKKIKEIFDKMVKNPPG